MVESYSTFLGIEMSAFGRLFNTKAVLSYRKEYEREEDKKIQSSHTEEKNTEKLTGLGYREVDIEDARYEMVEDQPESLKENQRYLVASNQHRQSKPDLTDNKYLNHYLRNQATTYPIRGLNLDFRV